MTRGTKLPDVAVCKNCGNTGTGITGERCPCTLPPEWRDEVHNLRTSVGMDRAYIGKLEKEIRALKRALRAVQSDLRENAAVTLPTAILLTEALNDCGGE